MKKFKDLLCAIYLPKRADRISALFERSGSTIAVYSGGLRQD